MKHVDELDRELDRELVELFRPRRPDARSFREAVERRVAEKSRSAGDVPPKSDSVAARRAAGTLPIDALPVDPVSTALAGAIGGKGVAKLAAAFGVPMALLAAMVASFVLGARSIARSSRTAEPPVDKGEHLRPLGGWLISHFAMALIPLLPPLALWVPGLSPWFSDVLLVGLLYCIAALALSVRMLARTGLWSRVEMARLGLGVLSSMYLGSFLWIGSWTMLAPVSELGLGWCGTVVAAGAAVCGIAAMRGRLQVFGLALAALIALGVREFSPPVVGADAGELRRELAEFQADVEEFSGWDQAAARFEALRAVGEPIPSLERIEAAVADAIERGRCEHNVERSASRMGLIDVEHWRLLAARPPEPYALDMLLRSQGAIRNLGYEVPRISMLLAVRQLTPQEREHLVRRVIASWPRPDSFDPLDVASHCVRLLDLLGRPDLADGFRQDAHELLRSHWVRSAKSRFVQLGGFTTDPERFEQSFPDATWHAVELMARFGAPEGIDLRFVRGHLRSQVPFGIRRRLDPSGDLSAVHRATLLRLEREIGLPARPWWRVILDERLLLASVLLVLLCWFGIAIARPAEPEGPGALP